MTEEKLTLSIEQMLSMIGISDSEYAERMKEKKLKIGVGTKANIQKVVECIKNETFEHFGCEFSEIQNFQSKTIHQLLKKFMGRQDEKPPALEIGSVRRGRKRKKTSNCKFKKNVKSKLYFRKFFRVLTFNFVFRFWPGCFTRRNVEKTQ